MERADLGAGGHRRGEDLRTERAARVDHRLAAVHPERAGQRRDRVVGDGQDDQLDLVEDRLRVGEDAADVDQRAEPFAPARVAAGDRVDRPAGARQGDAERGADRAGADDPDDRRLARAPSGGAGGRGRSGCVSSPWRCEPGGGRIEVDAGRRRWPPRISARSRSGSSPGRSPQAFIGAVRGRSRRATIARASRRVYEPAGVPAGGYTGGDLDPGRAHPPGAD